MQYRRAEVAPIERPQSMNFLNPAIRKYFIMLSLHRKFVTNVLFFLDAIGDEISFAFAASRKIKGTESIVFAEGS